MSDGVERFGGWAAFALALLIALLVATRSAPPATISRAARGGDANAERFGLSLATRQALFRSIADNDMRWRGFALASFPKDEWGQADHWTDHMSAHVRKLAQTQRLSVTQVLLAYDEGLHAGWRSSAKKPLRATWPPLTKHTR